MILSAEEILAKIPPASKKVKTGSQNKMKTKCKNINIRNPENLIPAIKDVVFRHCGRFDFRNLLFRYGLSVRDYELYLLSRDKTIMDEVIHNIAEECARRITDRNLNLRPVEIRIKSDKSTGKVRQIGKESAMQQCFDYIAFYAAKEIFNRRIVPEQASSIPGRGQIYGKDIIRGWIIKDVDSLRYAKLHGKRYTRKCKYHVKSDVIKCYPSAKLDKFMVLFEKDCGNEDLVWLWYTLLKSHQVDGYTGFMIGSLVSQWACQYMISFAYRHIKNLHYERRGKKTKCVEHMLIFMDDMEMTGSNRKLLKSAIQELKGYMESELGFKLKDNWQIHDIDKDPIDMMGYIFYPDGHVEIRGRDFIKARRLALRYKAQGNFLSIRQCKRILSYKGFFKHSDSRYVSKKYDLDKIFEYAAQKLSIEERRKNGKLGREKFPEAGNG